MSMSRGWGRRSGVAMTAALAVMLPAALLISAARAGAADADPPPAAGAPPPVPVKPPTANVRIVFTVLPSTKKATVSWGKKKLGVIAPHAPLIVQRPRDSGPLDVGVRAEGCVPVQTRAYTCEDSKLAVHVTPVAWLSKNV